MSPVPRHRPDDRPTTDSATPTWTKRESDAAFRELGDRVIDATQRFLRSGRRQRMQSELYTIGDHELTLPQVDVLEAVAGGDLRMHELAAHLGLDPSTVTRTTAPLVDLGLLERFNDPANRRYVVLRCTAEGHTTAEWLAEQRRRLMREILEPMAPDRRLLFADLLDEYTTLTEQYQARQDPDA